MGIFGKIDPKSKVNVWVLVLISLVPFVCVYSFTRIKKFRKMLAVNGIVITGFIMYLIVRYDIANQPEQVLDSIKWMNYLIIPGIDAFFVWKWARDYTEPKLKIFKHTGVI